MVSMFMGRGHVGDTLSASTTTALSRSGLLNPARTRALEPRARDALVAGG